MLDQLFKELAEVFDGEREIEKHAREALLESVGMAAKAGSPVDGSVDLPEPVKQVMSAADAHPICRLISATPFQWLPPQTSSDPGYIEVSLAKVHVELLGPTGLVASDTVRLGLYGMLPNTEYGVRTHPAEEIYIMLAGQVDWKRGTDPYLPHGSGERSHHPSMLEHANRTCDYAFMSVYVWHGDISTEQYHYAGTPATD